jgi:DNA-binding XRE family transcriptional regulator
MNYKSVDDMINSGEIDEPVPHGLLMELLALMNLLKKRREQMSLSLTDVSNRSGLTRTAVSKLENGWNNNPTLGTLFRYAQAIDMNVKLSAEPN